MPQIRHLIFLDGTAVLDVRISLFIMSQFKLKNACFFIVEQRVKVNQKARILEHKRINYEEHCSDNLYAVSIKEDMTYLCLKLHSAFTKRRSIRQIIIIKSDTSLSSGSSSSDEYDSSSSSGSLSSPNEYEIVSSKGPYKYLLKWYDDTTDEDIPEFKFLKRKTKGNASSSSACCDDTSNQEFPDDDNSSNEDFPDDDDRNDEDFQVEVKKAKTCKGKSSKSTGCKTKGFNSSKTKVFSKPKTFKSPFSDSSDEDMYKSSKSTCYSSDDDIPKSSKSHAKTSKGKASYSTAYKTRASTSSKSKGVPQAITLKNPVAQPIIVKSLIAIKNCVIGLENRKIRDRIQKKQFRVRKPTVADGSDCSFGV
ncbi:hypothetical protein Tco_0640642 [Tanacetum coccineum]